MSKSSALRPLSMAKSGGKKANASRAEETDNDVGEGKDVCVCLCVLFRRINLPKANCQCIQLDVLLSWVKLTKVETTALPNCGPYTYS